MKFNFTLGNHSITGAATLLDLVENIGCQLQDLGHEVVRDDLRLSRDAINIFFEAFDRPYAERLAKAKRAGAKFVIVATERPGSPGFNNQTGTQMIERQLAFPLCAPHAEAVWCLVPEMVDWAKKFNPKSCYLELGYSPTREKLLASDVEPEFDFSFFGSLTRRRRTIIAQIEKLGHTVKYIDGGETLPTPEERNALVRSAKISLSINPYHPWGLVSNSRLSTSLHLGRSVIAEQIDGAFGAWDHIATVAPSEFINAATSAIDSWVDLYVAQAEDFRRLMPPEICLREPLEMLG